MTWKWVVIEVLLWSNAGIRNDLDMVTQLITCCTNAQWYSVNSLSVDVKIV